MGDHEVQTAPQTYARIGGVLYLIVIVGGIFGEAFVRGGLIVPGDATATAENISSSELLWRAGVAGEIFMLVCCIPMALIFYVLLRPVSRDLALMAVWFDLAAIILEASNELNLLRTLIPSANPGYLRALDPEQLHVLANLSIESYAFSWAVGLIFFGCYCLVVGHLVFRSGYLPKVIGVLMQAAGLSYLINSFAIILSPKFAEWLFPVILLPALVGEASLCLWLLVKGVNVPKWNARASAKPASGALSGA